MTPDYAALAQRLRDATRSRLCPDVPDLSAAASALDRLAGALIAAEIDRLQRAQPPSGAGKEE
jgi:hypothetical protein